MAFQIEFEPAAIRHLKVCSAYERSILLQAIQDLTHNAVRESRNRKRLQPNPLCEWELRLGGLRVFYDASESEQKVRIVAIGRKIHNRLIIEGKEYPL